MARFAALGLVLLGQWQLAGAVGPHMQFQFSDSGVIEMKQKPSARLNVKGGDLAEGVPLVLWMQQAQSHEQFTHDNGLIRLKGNPGLCLNIEGGLGAGKNLVTWHCGEHGHRLQNEEFVLAGNGQIHPKGDKALCLNVKGGEMALGAEVVLWQCEGFFSDREFFKYDDEKISVKSHPKLHFNVAGGDLSTPGNKVVLWEDHAGAHEVFEVFDGRIHLKSRPELCLNAERGLQAGHRIVIWPCSPVPVDNELFHFDAATGVIHASRAPELGFNAAGGAMAPGDEIILWHIREEEL